MVSAAARAAKAIAGAGRNRPSKLKAKSSDVDAETAASSTNSAAGGGGDGGPSWQQSLSSQYESLSEKLARENEKKDGGDHDQSNNDPDKMSRKVRWAETARIASTMDATGQQHNIIDDDDEIIPPVSPLDIISDLFQKKYTLPIFLVLTTFIFMLVHLAGGPSDDSFERYNTNYGNDEGGNNIINAARYGGSSSRGGVINRQKNVAGGDGFDGDVIFELTPTVNPKSSHVPTVSVIHHTTPKIAPLGAHPSIVGNEPGWILVPTRTGMIGGLLASDRNDNSPTTLKWGFGPGVPTPDPALLEQHMTAAADDGSPTTLKWNLGVGVPTPDPALLIDKGSPTTLMWNYPPGTPTPDPALLIEVAAPDDNGSPTTLKWSFPEGEPTPDPALLVGVPDTMTWGYPPGIPTPDPVLLTGGIDTPQVDWGYPPGYPTPDPALLTEIAAPVGWGYPEGEPTPDPALLNGIVLATEAPTIRQVDVAVEVAPPVDLTLKTVDITPDMRGPPPTLPPLPLPLPPPPPSPKFDKAPKDPDATKKPTPPPIQAVDSWYQPVEVAPKAKVPRPKPAYPRPARAPRPLVNSKPYGQVPGGSTVSRPSDWIHHPGWSGPNGITIKHQGQIPEQPGVLPQQPGIIPQQPGIIPQYQYPNVVIPQQPQSSCGCCCCNCGGGSVAQMGGGGMVVPFTSQGYMQHQQQLQQQQGGVGMLPQQPLAYQHAPQHLGIDTTQLLLQTPETVTLPVEEQEPLGCPWDCVIDETVGTWGTSNEDDALYEIFYTNPLNCCGTIVEIGAGNGWDDSTSRFFEEGMNWTSVLTEANPNDFNKLADNRNHPKTKTIPGAFCDETPFLYFDDESKQFESVSENDNGYSSELMTDFEISQSTPKVSCIRLDKILSGIEHVNVMVIRAKGDPWAVIRTMDWDISVDIWLIDVSHTNGAKTLRAALKLHDYVQAAWDIKLWCDSPDNCVNNEVWLRKDFNPLPNRPLLQENRHLLRGGIDMI